MSQATTTNSGLTLEGLNRFPGDSQLWIYQISPNQQLSSNEILEIQQQVAQFAKQWQVHGQPVEAYGDLIFGQFVLFAVSANSAASGCSIDASVNFLKQLGDKFQIDFFNRTQIAYVNPENGEIVQKPLSQVKSELKSGELNPKIYFFNNTITRIEQLDGEWMIAFEDSWLAPKA